MRVTPPVLAAHRAELLRAAGELFRTEGLDGVGVAEISRAAGLTHGAFYGHFPSKTALAAAACTASLETAARRWRARAARARAAGGDPIGALIDTYLTERHRDEPQHGCMLASLGTEGARDPALRAALAAGAVGLAEVLAELLAARHPGAGPGACETAALGILAAMNGGLALARALADEPARSGAALRGAATAAHAAVDCFAPTDSAPGPA